MAVHALQREERIGLAAAIIAHAALIAFLVLRPPTGDIVRPPERIVVSLSEEVGLISTSPAPSTEASSDVAPTIGEVPPAEPEVVDVAPPSQPPAASPEPPRPAPRTEERPAAVARERPRPERPRPSPPAAARPAPPAPARPAPSPSPAARAAPPTRPAERSGGSRIGSDFLEGTSDSRQTSTSAAASAIFGPQEQASLAQAIVRQLKPHWNPPAGADSERLVSVVRFRLNRDGSLAGTPQVVRQSGITPANQPQAARHAEQAVRAVRLAAPFDLPERFYDGWKSVTSNFDHRLSE